MRLAAALALARLGHAPEATTLVDTLGLGSREHSRLIAALFDEIAAVAPEQLVALIARPELPSAVRDAAIDALSLAPDSGIVGVLTGLALDETVGAHGLAFYLQKLGEIGDRSVAPIVANGLDHPRARVRSAAAQAAGQLHLDFLAPRLAQLLSDSNWWVRFRAAEALVALGTAGRDRLREIAVSEPGVAQKTAAITLAEHALAA